MESRVRGCSPREESCIWKAGRPRQKLEVPFQVDELFGYPLVGFLGLRIGYLAEGHVEVGIHFLLFGCGLELEEGLANRMAMAINALAIVCLVAFIVV